MSGQLQPAGEPQGSWGVILLVYAVGVLSAATISQAIPVIGDLARLFHAGAQAGWIISIPSALVAIGALLAGWLVDRFGDKAVLVVGCAIIIAGDAGVVGAPSLHWLLAMRVLEGVGYFCISVAALAILTRATHGKRRNSALALWSSYIPMSFALPFVFAGQLAGSDHWRWAFKGHALMLATLLLPALMVLPAGRRAAGSSRSAGLARVLRTPGPYVLGFTFACMAFMQTGLLSILPRLLTGQYGVTIGVAGSVGTLGMMCKAAGCLAGGPLLNHRVPPTIIAGAGIALAIAGGVSLGFPLPSFGLAVVTSCIFFFGAGLVVGLWALVPTVAPDRNCLGAVSGVVTQVAIWGVLLGPPAAFAAQAEGGWALESAGIIVAGAIIVLCVWLVVTRMTPDADAAGRGLAAH
jgi:MFS family permease